MKKEAPKSADQERILHEQILHSMLASFKIEGIIIPKNAALESLKKIEASLEKQI